MSSENQHQTVHNEDESSQEDTLGSSFDENEFMNMVAEAKAAIEADGGGSAVSSADEEEVSTHVDSLLEAAKILVSRKKNCDTTTHSDASSEGSSEMPASNANKKPAERSDVGSPWTLASGHADSTASPWETVEATSVEKSTSRKHPPLPPSSSSAKPVSNIATTPSGDDDSSLGSGSMGSSKSAQSDEKASDLAPSSTTVTREENLESTQVSNDAPHKNPWMVSPNQSMVTPLQSMDTNASNQDAEDDLIATARSSPTHELPHVQAETAREGEGAAADARLSPIHQSSSLKKDHALKRKEAGDARSSSSDEDVPATFAPPPVVQQTSDVDKDDIELMRESPALVSESQPPTQVGSESGSPSKPVVLTPSTMQNYDSLVQSVQQQPSSEAQADSPPTTSVDLEIDALLSNQSNVSSSTPSFIPPNDSSGGMSSPLPSFSSIFGSSTIDSAAQYLFGTSSVESKTVPSVSIPVGSPTTASTSVSPRSETATTQNKHFSDEQEISTLYTSVEEDGGDCEHENKRDSTPKILVRKTPTRAKMNAGDSTSGLSTGSHLPLSEEDHAFIRNAALAKKRVRVVQLFIIGVVGIIVGLFGSVYVQSTCSFVTVQADVGSQQEAFDLRYGFWKYSPIDSAFDGYSYCTSYDNRYTNSSSPYVSRIAGVFASIFGNYALFVLWYYLITGRAKYKAWNVSVRLLVLAGLMQATTFFIFADTVCRYQTCSLGPGAGTSIAVSVIWFLLAHEMNTHKPVSNLIRQLNASGPSENQVAELELEDFKYGVKNYVNRLTGKAAIPTLNAVQRRRGVAPRSVRNLDTMSLHSPAYRPPPIV